MSPPYDANVIEASSSLVNAVAPDEKSIVTIGACHSTFVTAAVVKSEVKRLTPFFVPGTPTKTSMPLPAMPA